MALRSLVLLATYNGRKYVHEQLDSIVSQTASGIHVLVRDDGSADGTQTIVRLVASERPGLIDILSDNTGRLGSSFNFSRLLEAGLSYTNSHGSAYFLLCDQDDIWLPKKVETLTQRMRVIEEHNKGQPVLVHSDLKVVDSNLRVLSPSLWRHEGIRPERRSLNQLLMQNVVTGCATLMNMELARLATPIPKGVMMHDWWIALIASAFGHIEAVSEPLVLYRQHGLNEVGAKKYGIQYLREHWRDYWYRDGLDRKIERHLVQAETFYAHFRDRLSLDQRAMLLDFIGLRNQSRFDRIRVMLRRRFFVGSLLRSVGILARI